MLLFQTLFLLYPMYKNPKITMHKKKKQNNLTIILTHSIFHLHQEKISNQTTTT